jgi:hypothetical protein
LAIGLLWLEKKNFQATAIERAAALLALRSSVSENS